MSTHYVLIVLFDRSPLIAVNLDKNKELLLTDDLLNEYAKIVDMDRARLSGYKLKIANVFGS